MSQNQYDRLGASASKAGLHSTLAAEGLAASKELFASVVEDLSGDPNFASFIHADGSGTKSLVAYLHYKETGSIELFPGLADDALVMNLDDIYCIGRPEKMVLSNTIGRNAKLIGDDIIGAIIGRYKQLSQDLSALGIPIALGGGETADCGDIVRTIVVDATMAGRIERKNLIRASEIKAGDVIVGLASFGKASYEFKTNSGIGSNGLTLARHCMLNGSYRDKYPECCEPSLGADIAYRGPYKTTDTVPGLDMSVGEALASPTRTYAPVLNRVYQTLGSDIHGVIHNTGGGQTKVLRFGSGKKFIKDNLFPCPKIFSLIQEHGDVPWKEMYQVFNMGHRIEIYCSEAQAEKVIAIAEGFSISARRIGHVESNTEGNNCLELRSEHGQFSY